MNPARRSDPEPAGRSRSLTARRLRLLAPLLLALASLQCLPDFLATPRQPQGAAARRAQILLSPRGASLGAAGAGLTLRATVLDEQGIVMLGRPVAWTSLSPDVATVDAVSGAVTAVRSGQAVIAASAPVGDGGAWVDGYALVTVAAPSAAPLGAFATGPSPSGEQLNAVWGSSPSEVYAVGGSGTILRSNGTAWSAGSSPTAEHLWGVWGVGSAPGACARSYCAAAADRAYAVGEHGTILKLRGVDTWTVDTVFTAEALSAVWAASPRAVFAVGAAGTILRHDTAWAPMASPTTRNLRAVWGTSDNNVYAVGGGGTILHYDGTQWAEDSSGTSAVLTDIWGTGPGEIFVSAADGSVLRGNGREWTTVARDTTAQFYAVWGVSSLEVYAAGSGGAVLRWDGSTWARMPTATAATIHGLWGTSESRLYAVGVGGTVAVAARGGAARLVVAEMTLGSLSVGPPIAAEVHIVDAAGNRVSGASDTVRLSLGRAPAGAALLGTTAVAANDGRARFTDLRVTRPGSDYVLVASAAGLGSAQGPSFAVAPGVLRGLAFATQPTNVALAGAPVTPPIQVSGQDTFGNRVPLPEAVRVTVSVASGPDTTLLGTVTEAPLQGAVTFQGLSLTIVGSGYRLRAFTSAPGIQPAVSDPFAVLGPGPAATVNVGPAGIVLESAGAAGQLRVVGAADAFGNPVPVEGASWRSENPAVAAVGPSGQVAAVASGQTAVGATVGPVTGYATVTVSLPGATPVRTWTPVASGTSRDLLAIWAYSATAAYAPGDGVSAWLDPAGWHSRVEPELYQYAAATGSGSGSAFVATHKDVLNPNGTHSCWVVFAILELGGPPADLWRTQTTDFCERPGVWASNPQSTWVFGPSESLRRVSSRGDISVVSAPSGPGFVALHHGWGVSDQDVWAVGDQGTRLRRVGAQSSVWRESGLQPPDLYAVWGSTSSDVFAVGAAGTIWRWDGTAWSLMTSGTAAPLYDVWGTSGTDVYAVGAGGLILHFDGTRWDPMTSGSTQDLRGVMGVPSGEVFVVGLGGTILKGTR